MFMGAEGGAASRSTGRGLRGTRLARGPATYRFIGFTPVRSTAAWADFQIRVGSDMEAFLKSPRAAASATSTSTTLPRTC
jgi:hypothetical protein